MQKYGKRSRNGFRQPWFKKSLRNSKQFPFLWNKYTVSHIRKSNVMFIMRGLPGSGKSSVARRIKSKYKSAVVCSADDFFYKDDGTYCHDVERLPDAHRYCKDKAEEAVLNGKPHVVIDNTNIRRREMKFYFSLAGTYNYVVIIVLPDTLWQSDPVVLQYLNKHGCTLEYIEAKKKLFHECFPLYWGWFLNKFDSQGLTSSAERYFSACIEAFPDFRKDITVYQDLSDDDPFTFQNIYNIQDSTILHCTAFYAGGHGDKETPGTKEYSERDSVRRSIGKTFLLSVIGFVFTPRTAGARIHLNGPQMKLWGSEDKFCYKFDEKGHKIPSDPTNDVRKASQKNKNDENDLDVPLEGNEKKKKQPKNKLKDSEMLLDDSDSTGNKLECCEKMKKLGQNKESLKVENEDFEILDFDMMLPISTEDAGNFTSSEHMDADDPVSCCIDERLSGDTADKEPEEGILEKIKSKEIFAGYSHSSEFLSGSPCLDVDRVAVDMSEDFASDELNSNDVLPLFNNPPMPDNSSVPSPMCLKPGMESQFISGIDLDSNLAAGSLDDDTVVSESSTSSLICLEPGSRAHLTIGCANGIQAVQTGFDVMDVIWCNDQGLLVGDPVIFEDAMLLYFGDGRCEVYFDWSKKFSALFTGKY